MRQDRNTGWIQRLVTAVVKQIGTWGNFTRFAAVMIIVGVGGLHFANTPAGAAGMTVLVLGGIWLVLYAHLRNIR